MALNLMNSAHKTTNEAYRVNYDRIFRKDEKDDENHESKDQQNLVEDRAGSDGSLDSMRTMQ